MIKYFFKFFIYDGDKKILKSSFVLPFITMIIGSFVILLSFSIMEGFSNELSNTIHFFDKKNSLEINKKILNENNSNNTDNLINYLKVHNYLYNAYEERVMFFKNLDHIFVAKVFGLYDIKEFLNNDYLIFNDDYHPKSDNKLCIIGYDKYINTDIDLGQNINLISFSDFYNLNSTPISDHIVVNSIKTNISHYDNCFFISYDSLLFNKNITLKINLNREIDSNHLSFIKTHYSDGIKYNNNLNTFTELFTAIEFEKISYAFFGIFIVLISSVMLMGYNITSILRNVKAIAIMETLGITKKNISITYLLYSMTLALLGFLVALFLVYLFISFDKKYLIMDYIFDPNIYFNFDLFLNANIILFTIILNLVFTIISTLFPIYKISKLDIVDSLNFRI